MTSSPVLKRGGDSTTTPWAKFVRSSRNFYIYPLTSCYLQLHDPDFIKLPIPNDRVLPLVEMLQIREMLSQAQDELAALDFEIARTKAIYDALLTQRGYHMSRMERLQAMVAPQKTLPDEILAEVFVFVASHEDPVVVPPISRHYRKSCPWN